LILVGYNQAQWMILPHRQVILCMNPMHPRWQAPLLRNSNDNKASISRRSETMMKKISWIPWVTAVN